MNSGFPSFGLVWDPFGVAQDKALGLLPILQDPRRAVVITLNFSITIPDRLTWPFVALVLLYRRLRYGYAFRRIALTRGKYAIVDPEDFERLNKHKWYASRTKNTYYACRSIQVARKRTIIHMHREIINPPKPMVVDHINHNGLDNRKANLRPATHQQNTFNRSYTRKKRGSSKYKGVSWTPHVKMWRVRIWLNYKRKSIGYCKDELEAAKAYDKAAKKYHGEFASLNFPDSPRRAPRTRKPALNQPKP